MCWRLFLCLLMLVSLGCTGSTDVAPAPDKPSTQYSSSPFKIELSGDFLDQHRAERSETERRELLGTTRFRDVHEEAGLKHVYVNGECGKCLMVETIGAAAGWLDYDADGHWDLYLNQGGDPTVDPDDKQPNDSLFRNRGDGTFEDVTVPAGIAEYAYSQCLAVGDFDDDGFDDVYVTNVGRNTLFHNQGDGTFVEVTDTAGVGDPRWSASAAWADLDLDGDLDLYVCNYCVYDPKKPLVCRNEQGEDRVCHPRDVKPWPDECYINQGDGTFTAEAEKRGLVGPGNRALGVAVADFDVDGLPDVYVTNDTTANFLFINQGDGVFEDWGTVLGCAVDRNGGFQASMGVAVGDFDHNNYLDLYVTHFYQESNTLYRNYGPEGFQDETGLLGLHRPTLMKLAFGTVMLDFNQDTYDELFITTGHIENFPGNPKHKMEPQHFAFDGKRWVEISDLAGDFFKEKRVGRGVAYCDYDHDGDLDLAVAHENSPLALLRNESQRGHWLRFLFRGRENNRRGIGCRVTVEAGDSTYMQELCGGTSYAATHQPALVFGLGDWEAPCGVTIRWPNGVTQKLDSVDVDQTLVIEETVEKH